MNEQLVRHDPKMILHSHPVMEKVCKVPEGHVIIDYAVFFELVRIHGRYVTPKHDRNCMKCGNAIYRER